MKARRCVSDSPIYRDSAESDRLCPPATLVEVVDAVCFQRGWGAHLLSPTRDEWCEGGPTLRAGLRAVRSEIAGVARALVPGPPSYPDLARLFGLAAHSNVMRMAAQFDEREDRDAIVEEIVSTIAAMRDANARRSA